MRVPPVEKPNAVVLIVAVRSGSGEVVFDRLQFVLLFPGVEGARFIQGDAGQPGAERRLASKLVDLVDRFEKTVLQDILGILSVGRQSAHQGIDSLLVGLYQLRKGLEISGLRLCD